MRKGLRKESGWRIQERIGRNRNRPSPKMGNTGVRLRMFDWPGLGLIISLKTTATVRCRCRPVLDARFPR
jgi:hypothetical protein